MKILFVIDNLGSGGAQRQVVTLATALRQRGHRTAIFRYAPGDLMAGPAAQAGVELFAATKARRFSLAPVVALRRLLNAEHPDAVIAFLRTPSIYTITAARSVRSNTAVIVSERFYDPPEGVGVLTSVGRQLYRFADHVVVNSHHQRRRFEQKYPALRSCLSTIYNGLDLSHFRPPAAEPADGPLRLLAVGSVSPHKNGLTLVRAVKMARQAADIHVTWVGEHVSTLSDRRAYSEAMKHEIAEANLGDSWTWHPQTNRIVDLLHSHHALVHPSFGEGLPNAVCEAMACARPVILSDTLDHPHLIAHGRSGLLFDYRSAQALADSIVTFARLPLHVRHKMGRRARERAEALFALDRLAAEYEGLVRSLRRGAPATSTDSNAIHCSRGPA